MSNVTAAPKGVGWGTTNTPVEKRIDPTAHQYKTRSGKSIIGLQIVLHTKYADGSLHEVTFPVTGSIDRGKGKQPRYAIWTLDGRANLFSESPNDLILAD